MGSTHCVGDASGIKAWATRPWQSRHLHRCTTRLFTLYPRQFVRFRWNHPVLSKRSYLLYKFR